MLSNTMIKLIKTLPVILSIKETAAFLNIHYKTVYRIINKKDILAYKDNENNWCINREDLAIYLDKNCNL